MAKRDVAVLISGSGSNLQALIDAVAADPDHPARIRLVISNRPGVKGLDRAAAAGIEAIVIEHKHFHDRAGFDAALDAALRARGIELVCLAGSCPPSRGPMRSMTRWPPVCGSPA